MFHGQFFRVFSRKEKKNHGWKPENCQNFHGRDFDFTGEKCGVEGRLVGHLKFSVFFPVKIKISSVKIFSIFRVSIREFFFPSVKIS